MELIIKSDCGKTVHSTNEWKELCPPLGHSDQWVDKRSAKELARSVFETGTLPEIINEVLSDMNISLPSEMWGIPEKPTRLPWAQYGKRKHDLWLYDIHSEVAVSIEAKTDESFDRKLSQKRATSAKKNSDGGANMNTRLDGILDYLYQGNPPKYKDELYYQLLSATTGAILEAKNNGINKVAVVFLVFKSDILSTRKLKTNEEAWDLFCDSLGINYSGGMIQRDNVDCFITKREIQLS